MRTQRRVYERMSGEIQGSHTESKVALIEPIASRLQRDGSILEKATGSLRLEIGRMFRRLHEARIQADPRPPMADLSPCRYVFVPSGLCLARETTKNLLGFVRRGGALLATLAPGLYDGRTRPDGTILKALGVAAEPLALGRHQIVFPRATLKLPPAISFAYKPLSSFKGKVIVRYKDGRPCWIDAPLGKGRVLLVGFAANLSAEAVSKHIIPAVFDRSSLADWKLDADHTIDCFVRVKGRSRLFFLTNRDYKSPRRAVLSFNKPHTVTDLRAGLTAESRRTIVLPRLSPGECRILKATP